MREVRLRPSAQLDIESLFIYVAVECAQPSAAQKIVDELYATFDRLSELPELGMRFAHDDLEQDYRRTLVGQYWVYYTFDSAELIVWRIFHTRRDDGAYTLVDL